MEIILTETDPRLGVLAVDGSIQKWPAQDSDGRPVLEPHRYSRRGFGDRYFVLCGVNRDNPETIYRLATDVVNVPRPAKAKE